MRLRQLTLHHYRGEMRCVVRGGRLRWGGVVRRTLLRVVVLCFAAASSGCAAREEWVVERRVPGPETGFCAVVERSEGHAPVTRIIVQAPGVDSLRAEQENVVAMLGRLEGLDLSWVGSQLRIRVRSAQVYRFSNIIYGSDGDKGWRPVGFVVLEEEAPGEWWYSVGK